MARPKIPIKILKNKGTYQECRHGDRDEIELPTAIPEKPEFLSDCASEEWDRLVPLLMDYGIISDIDGAVLAVYCELFSEFKSTRSCPAAFPASKFASLRAASADLGLSPAARTKIPASKKDPKKKNPFAPTPTGKKKRKTG